MDKIYREIREAVSSDSVLDKLFLSKKVLNQKDTEHNQEPEEFTKRTIVEPLLEFLGYPRKSFITETGLTVRDRRHRDADYKITLKTQFILLEAEPINKDLEARNTGASQVREWLNDRFALTEFGIATDGFVWKLLKVSYAEKDVVTVASIDLSPFLASKLNHTLHETNEDLQEIFNDFFFNFSSTTILDALSGETTESLEKQSEVTSRFYSDYIKYIFGIERGKKVKITNCLLNKINTTKEDNPEGDRRLFAVITMNRLIFTKFLQDKGIIQNDFLSELVGEYNKNSPTTFYESFLKPFFYDILSKPPNERRVIRGGLFSNIPYLNGGLFVPTVPDEKEYNIENDILFEIIEDFLSHYDLTYSQDAIENRLNPDILGRVFEKTINYITSKSENFNKKEQGAFYTPSEITNYLCDNSLKRFLFSKSIATLRELGHSPKQLGQWIDYDDLLKNLPKRKKLLEALYQIVQKVKVLDPACGSGHFLKDSGDLLLKINRVFCFALKVKFSTYSALKQIIINNLHGVDIDPNAVEIAKLRLWMALIDSAEAQEKLQALPNIEYNIRRGNSLVGFINIPNLKLPLMDEYLELDILEKLVSLKTSHPRQMRKIESLASSPTVKNLTKIKEILIGIYKNEDSPDTRNSLKEIIEEILVSIQSKASEQYLAYVHQNVASQTTPKRPSSRLIMTTVHISRESLQYLTPFHWVIEFSEIIDSGGFDVIIENPPYEILKTRDREFFESYQRDFRFLPKKKQETRKKTLLKDPKIKNEWDKYAESFDSYQTIIKFLPEYALSDNVLGETKWKKSDPNYYRLFIERSNQLLNEKGRLGMICAKGFIGELGSTALRRFLLSSYTLFEFREFNNRTPQGLIFDDVDPNFRFVVFTYLKEKGDNEIAYCFCKELGEISRPYETFERNTMEFYLELNGDDCIINWIRSDMDFKILAKLAKFPKLGDENVGFNLKSGQDIHMTNDQDKFGTSHTTIPLVEGKMINHYSFTNHPQYYVIPDKYTPKDYFSHETVVIRTILPNSVRKFYSTILPPHFVIANSLVYFEPEQTREEQCFVVALLNSLLIEYRGRQLLSKMTLNQYIIDILPIPREMNDITREIARLSSDLIDERVQENERQRVMNHIDSLVFKLFGLNQIEMKFVMNSFMPPLPEENKTEILEMSREN